MNEYQQAYRIIEIVARIGSVDDAVGAYVIPKVFVHFSLETSCVDSNVDSFPKENATSNAFALALKWLRAKTPGVVILGNVLFPFKFGESSADVSFVISIIQKPFSFFRSTDRIQRIFQELTLFDLLADLCGQHLEIASL